MIREKLFYKNVQVQEMREFRAGGQNMAEISIVVPRKELTETQAAIDFSKAGVVEVDEDVYVSDAEEGNQKPTTTVTSEENEEKDQLTIVATKGDTTIVLGALGSDEYLAACESNKFNPVQIDLALDGSIKTHKGFTFKQK
ncbi:hypothetical protein [Vagococcus fluvialis]|uniref:hypothetical protein n=1 Tax=Vagococcus fluvialis TaxID=2738 RepID=UPI001D0B3200|nr:hypothetical protein [Vagococcus fluvialis]UDM72695.1 hypothetical protein K5L00_15015 [Vagococcus fluvialis]UDM78418.1 hypothetical protein K5K98_14350 [Vagococcus fluvialis]UDM83970.1 hypothetical protein K5K96_15040 [Vagococcus fluvialis]